MKKACSTRWIPALLAVVLSLTALPARAWELGAIATWMDIQSDDGDPGGSSYGGRLMLRHELWKHLDVGARCGFMHAESLDADFIPLEVTLALKYPFCEGTIVPFVGIAFGYHFYTGDDYKNSQALTPSVGLDWRFGEKKEWSLFVEGVYQFAHVHFTADDSERLIKGPGASIGVSCRF